MSCITVWWNNSVLYSEVYSEVSSVYIQSVHYKMLTLCVSVWQVLELVQRLLQEDKMATQREAYYCLVNHFKDQAEFNSTLQGNAQCSGTSS